MKRIGIFGGSFNPPHIGHVKICGWILQKCGVDEVWIVPCFIHPFGKELAPFEDRYRMCLFSFEQFGPKVCVSKIEKNLGGISRTIRTVRHFLGYNPDTKFLLVTGEDVSSQSSDWLDYDEIKRLVSIIEIPRGPGSPIPDVSATEVRRRVAAGESFASLVPREVAAYIVTHGLYR